MQKGLGSVCMGVGGGGGGLCPRGGGLSKCILYAGGSRGGRKFRRAGMAARVRGWGPMGGGGRKEVRNGAFLGWFKGRSGKLWHFKTPEEHLMDHEVKGCGLDGQFMSLDEGD